MAEEEQGNEQEAGFDDPMTVIKEQVQELDLVDIQEAEKIIERVRKQREKDARKEAQKEIKSVAERYGLNLEEIVPGTGSGSSTSTTKRKVPPKFRHPETGQTWTGRGRKPKWVQAWEEEGGSIEDLRITEDESAS